MYSTRSFAFSLSLSHKHRSTTSVPQPIHPRSASLSLTQHAQPQRACPPDIPVDPEELEPVLDIQRRRDNRRLAARARRPAIAHIASCRTHVPHAVHQRIVRGAGDTEILLAATETLELRIDHRIRVVRGHVGGEERREAVDVGGEAAVGEELVGLEVLPEGLGDRWGVAGDEEEVGWRGRHAVAEARAGGAGADARVGAGADAGEAGVGLRLGICGEVVVGGLAVGLGWGEGVVVHGLG